MRGRRITGLLLMLGVGVPGAQACSAFVLQAGDTLLVGKNLDWFCDHAFVTVNRRGTRKTSFLSARTEHRLRWTARYGSVTFNPNGVGFPSGGMNEAGLVIEESWLDETQYPAPDARPVIDEIQWIQYQLDTSATVDEVVQTDARLRIRGNTGKSHYLLCDRSGRAHRRRCLRDPARPVLRRDRLVRGVRRGPSADPLHDGRAAAAALCRAPGHGRLSRQLDVRDSALGRVSRIEPGRYGWGRSRPIRPDFDRGVPGRGDAWIRAASASPRSGAGPPVASWRPGR